MQIEVTGLEAIDNQDMFDYFEARIDQFKNEYDDAFSYECSKASNFVVTFHFDIDTQKMTLVQIPHNYRYVHNRLIEVYAEVMKWF